MADEIASKLIALLVEGFVAKKGRAPNESEVEQLFGELTEERVAELMGTALAGDAAVAESEPAAGESASVTVATAGGDAVAGAAAAPAGTGDADVGAAATATKEEETGDVPSPVLG